MSSSSIAGYLHRLNHDFQSLHSRREDAFWTSYMGLDADAEAAQKRLNQLEIEMQGYLQDPARLEEVRKRHQAVLASLTLSASADERTALAGWLRTLEAHVIDHADARKLSHEIVEAEGALARRRGSLALGYQDPAQGFVPASSVKLGTMLLTNRSEALRKAAFEALRSIEGFVLDEGFLEIVRLRNRLGRMLGGEDYYDWKVQRVERMSKREVFQLLDQLEERTRETARHALQELATQQGPDALRPWNIRHAISGDVSHKLDPYFPFSEALTRWGQSFTRLGIRYGNAELVLDLLDRPGKYENGFMHGPVPAWRENGRWRPARIQFTANAIPGMVGSGRRAAQTLFHEGGHAAHFANIDMPAPCFSQEYAPTSVAFSETQSMFLDSLLDDPAWQVRYARNLEGEPIPVAQIEEAIAAEQPYAAWSARGMLAVCYAERALYEIPDAELSRERVLAELRAVERRLLFLEEGGPRPTLSVPHLLSGESSAYYHGYVLAEMAVHQTREFFVQRDGYLVDNPAVGPDLRKHYWQPGNSVDFRTFIERLTGRPLGADAMAKHLCRDVREACEAARAEAARAEAMTLPAQPVQLDARIRVMHGNETICSAQPGTFDACAREFARWIGELEGKQANANGESTA